MLLIHDIVEIDARDTFFILLLSIGYPMIFESYQIGGTLR